MDIKKINIGDIVRIVDPGFSYTAYGDMASFFNMERYDYGNLPFNWIIRTYKVMNIANHLSYSNITLVYIEDMTTKKEYIIGIKGLRFLIRDFLKEEDFMV